MNATTKDGRTIHFEYFEQDPEDQKGLNAGFVCHRVDASVEGVPAGYLKISYVPHDRLDAAFPTIWKWAHLTQGWCFDDGSVEATWRGCHLYAHRTPASLRGRVSSYLSVRKDMTPDEVTMRADLAILERDAFLGSRTIWDRRRDWERDMVDRPIVDYIRVYEGDAAPFRRDGPTGVDFRRLRVATALYEAGARWLAETKGLPLHASGIQSDEAMWVWEAMTRAGRLPIEMRKRPWDDRKVPVLDYTGERT